jgi:hypothetical protein
MENIEFQNIELTRKLFDYHNTQETINPYLHPLYDALYDMLDFEKARAYIGQETIEIAPHCVYEGTHLKRGCGKTSPCFQHHRCL